MGASQDFLKSLCTCHEPENAKNGDIGEMRCDNVRLLPDLLNVRIALHPFPTTFPITKVVGTGSGPEGFYMEVLLKGIKDPVNKTMTPFKLFFNDEPAMEKAKRIIASKLP